MALDLVQISSDLIADKEVLALIQEGEPLSDMLKELISLRRWKEKRLYADAKESQRMERMLTRLCVSIETLSTLMNHSGA